MTTRAQIVAEARTWGGVPWRHMGRNRAGVDCCGLVAKVAHELGLSDYDFVGYTRHSFDHTFFHHFSERMRQKPIPEARPGDVVVFLDHTYPCHVGIVAERNGRPSLIHAYAGRRKVVEEEFTEVWQKKVAGVFEFYGLED